MDMIVNDRKVWTAMETRALITLKEEMKPKFQTMKRNRSLWVELSDKLRKHFGHERTPAQCAVRWKNIVSAYKDSRDALRNPRPDSKVCLFFKEVEAIQGDPPLSLPVSEDARTPSMPATPVRAHNPRKRERPRESKDSSVTSLLTELIAKVDAQGAALKRIEKTLAKGGMAGFPQAADVLPGSEPISVPLPDTVIAPVVNAMRPYAHGDPDVLLERPSAASVPELSVAPGATLQSDTAIGAQVQTVSRPSVANSTHSLPSTEQVTQEVEVIQTAGTGESVEEVATGEEETSPITTHVGRRVQTVSAVPSVLTEVQDAPKNGSDSQDRTDVETRTATVDTEEQPSTVQKGTEVPDADASVVGGEDIDGTGSGLESRKNTDDQARKKQKVAHVDTTAS